MSLGDGVCCCVKSGTDKLIFGAGVKLSIASSKFPVVAFLKYIFSFAQPQMYTKYM